MYDLIGGLATWTAFGMPTVGTYGDRHRIVHYVERVATVPFTATAADLPPPDARGPGASIAIVSPSGVLVGAVDASTVDALPCATRVRDVMAPAPSTIRPEQPVDAVAAQLRDDGLAEIFVTTTGGVLLGVVIVERLPS